MRWFEKYIVEIAYASVPCAIVGTLAFNLL